MPFSDTSQYPRLRLTRLSNLMDKSVNRAFQACGLDITNNQENVLRNLIMYGSMSQTCLAEYTGQDRNSLSRTLAILEKNGLIEKKISAEDRRYCEIFITPKGEKIHIRLMQVLENWRKSVFGQLPEGELKEFVEISEKLMTIMKKMENEL